MFSISVELLHGTFRGDPSGTANTGRLTTPEWPPTPFRLFSAFVAADGTGDRCRVTDGSELDWLERLPPPVIHADDDPPHASLQPRFVAAHRGRFESKGKGKVSVHQEYVGRKAALVRPGIRVAPRKPRLVYSWDIEPPTGTTLDALRLRAARIGYLGTSDSPVRLRVLADHDTTSDQHGAFVPDPAGDLAINVPRPGDLRVLDRMYEEWVQHGASVGRSQFLGLVHRAAYRSPWTARPTSGGCVVAWLRLRKPVPGRRIGIVTTLFKEAILSRYQREFGEPPAVLHGHGFVSKGYELARYLALPDVKFPHSRGRIHGLALWMPSECDDAEYRRARATAFSIRQLVGRSINVRVERRHGKRPFAVHPDRWTGSRRLGGQRVSRTWGTAFPAIHERRRPLDLAEVTRWCRHARLPAPVAFRAARTPLVRGAVDLAPVEVTRPGRPGLPYCHIELHFADPISGPVVIGSGRQRGFGLCVPLDRHDNKEDK